MKPNYIQKKEGNVLVVLLPLAPPTIGNTIFKNINGVQYVFF